MDVPLYILFSFSLIFLSAFISGSKKAFFVLDRSGRESLDQEEQDSPIRFLTQRPQKTLLTFLVAHQAIWIILIFMTVRTFPGVWERGGALIGLFLCYLLFGRLLPRILVLGKEFRYVRSVSPLLKGLVQFISPLRILLEKVLSFILRDRGMLEKPVIQDKDFKNLMPESGNNHEEYEREMIQNVMDFHDTLVKEVMTPRPDMFCIDEQEEILNVIQKIRAAGFSRIPIYSGDRDHIVGILYAKDCLPLLLTGVSQGEHLSEKLLHPALHVPETKRVSELLREFKKQNVHIAMVVDEFGGVEGLVCLEDLLEEIVGEIQDEGDVEEKLIQRLDQKTLRISAMLSLEDFNELFQVTIESEDYETIGGFVVDQFGYFPKWGEKIVYRGLEISVYRVKDVRILELLVSKLDADSIEDAGAGESE